MALLDDRLKSLHEQLLAAHRGGAGMPSAATRREREDFVELFLRNCVAPGLRFATGQMVDSHGGASRQLDIVVELPFAPSVSRGRGFESRAVAWSCQFAAGYRAL